MHHLKQFSDYSNQKKTRLIIAIIAKFAFFGGVFTGLMFLLKDYFSTGVLIALTHIILFSCLVAFLFIHKHLSHEVKNK